MTYKKTVELCLVAENRVKKKLSAMAMARKLSSNAKKPKPGPAEKKNTDIEEVPKEQKKARKPPSELTFLDLPKHLTGLSKEENTALSKKHYEEKKCKTCGNHNPTFGDHRNHECPYKMRAGYDWPEYHIPIKEKNAPNFKARHH